MCTGLILSNSFSDRQARQVARASRLPARLRGGALRLLPRELATQFKAVHVRKLLFRRGCVGYCIHTDAGELPDRGACDSGGRDAAVRGPRDDAGGATRLAPTRRERERAAVCVRGHAHPLRALRPLAAGRDRRDVAQAAARGRCAASASGRGSAGRVSTQGAWTESSCAH
ncbi:hypothetical protein T492DRAFT_541420 [Pavlovales sp. CCMP2436]|nr:hypothetical protein T492DRAFT_541420 [Pavlovales sp. CCMP2436]